MTEGKSEGLGRRGFLKWLGLGSLAAAGVGVTRWLGERRWDISTPEHLREFLGSSEIFPEWHSYFQGQVVLRSGTVIYNRPALSGEEAQTGLITTYSSGNTKMTEVKEGEELVIDRPFVFLGRPHNLSNPAAIRQVVGPGGVREDVDLGSSWVIFSLEDPDVPRYISHDVSASEYRVAATPIGNANLRFRGPDGQERIIPEGLNITFDRNLSFGDISVRPS